MVTLTHYTVNNISAFILRDFDFEVLVLKVADSDTIFGSND